MIFTYKYLIARYSTMFSKFFGLLNLNFFFNVLPFLKIQAITPARLKIRGVRNN